MTKLWYDLANPVTLWTFSMACRRGRSNSPMPLVEAIALSDAADSSVGDAIQASGSARSVHAGNAVACFAIHDASSRHVEKIASGAGEFPL